MLSAAWIPISSPPWQNGCHLADNISKCIFMNEKALYLIPIPLKFVPKGLIDNKSGLVQVMAWGPTGDKPLPEPMLTQFTGAYMRHRWVNSTPSSWSNLWSIYMGFDGLVDVVISRNGTIGEISDHKVRKWNAPFKEFMIIIYRR